MNLLGILVAFISPAAHAVSNIFDAYVSGNVFKRISTTIFYINLTNILGILCLPLFGPIHSLSLLGWLFVLLLSFINVGYQFPYFAALKKNRYISSGSPVSNGKSFYTNMGIFDCRRSFTSISISWLWNYNFVFIAVEYKPKITS